jgi:hypothetical protein
MIDKPLTKKFNQIPVKFQYGHSWAQFNKVFCDGRHARTNFNQVIVNLWVNGGYNLSDYLLVDQKILSKAFACLMVITQ